MLHVWVDCVPSSETTNSCVEFTARYRKSGPLASSTGWHTPATHPPPRQSWPHAPQLCGSAEVSEAAVQLGEASERAPLSEGGAASGDAVIAGFGPPREISVRLPHPHAKSATPAHVHEARVVPLRLMQ
jgi:hypothetical protein